MTTEPLPKPNWGFIAGMAIAAAFLVGWALGVCLWRQDCRGCAKERPHLEFYLCPECRAKAGLPTQKEDGK